MTNTIDVDVKTKYLTEQSDAQDSKFVFAYTITIQNNSENAAQLISRHWIVTDAKGEVQEVKGMGVIGDQPVIPAGSSYTYTSGVVLPTETGSMKGSYQMQNQSGELFDTPIPDFTLVPAHKLH